MKRRRPLGTAHRIVAVRIIRILDVGRRLLLTSRSRLRLRLSVSVHPIDPFGVSGFAVFRGSHAGRPTDTGAVFVASGTGRFAVDRRRRRGVGILPMMSSQLTATGRRVIAGVRRLTHRTFLINGLFLRIYTHRA